MCRGSPFCDINSERGDAVSNEATGVRAYCPSFDSRDRRYAATAS